MDVQWIRRRAHTRRSKSGRTTLVRGTWEQRSARLGKNKKQIYSYRHHCRSCGAEVISVRMPRGGWGHFEGREGLGRIKHPCFYRGEGLGRDRETDMDDLFHDPETSASTA